MVVDLGTHRALARLRKEWESPIYAFYQPTVGIKEDRAGKRAHEFHCGNKGCTTKITRWLDKGDSRSTSNLRKHTRKCWGDEILKAADGMKIVQAKEAVSIFVRTGSIRMVFKIQKKGKKETYSNRQHTKTEIRFVLSCGSIMMTLIHSTQGGDRALGC